MQGAARPGLAALPVQGIGIFRRFGFELEDGVDLAVMSLDTRQTMLGQLT